MIPSLPRAGVLKTGAYASVFVGISSLFFSCDRLTPLPKSVSSAASFAPSGGELYVFPHGRLGLSAFEVLRRSYPEMAPADVAKMAMAAQWLLTKLAPGKSATAEETTRCVRSLFPPTVSKASLTSAEAFVADRFRFASLDLLRQSYNDASSGWTIEWNPSLAREFGIPISKP